MGLTVVPTFKCPLKDRKQSIESYDLDSSAKGAKLYQDVAADTNLNLNRVRITIKPDASAEKGKRVVLRPSDDLSKYAVDGRVNVEVRDLGPQISWKTVILTEYIGPLILAPIFFFNMKAIYGVEESHTSNQWMVFIAIMLHFLKREYETLFVHRFSLATMPAFNLIKNCAHYWLVCGCLVSYFCFAPPSWAADGSKLDAFLYRVDTIFPDNNRWSLITAWVMAEGSNYATHLNLASLRRPGTTERKIPYGYGFTNVSCPNYSFEFFGWATLSCFTGNWAMLLFTIAGGIQMGLWAVKKHKRYLKEFPHYPKGRYAFLPYIV